MPTQKIDPKVIFASDAPAIDKPPVFSDKTKGWDVARANDGRPEIKQMNKMQQDTDLKILWLNENAVLPYDENIDYPDGAVTLKDGSFKQLSSGSWVEFLDDFADKDAVKRGIANRYDSTLTYNIGERVILANGDIVKSTVDGNTNNPNTDMTGWVSVGNTVVVDSIADMLLIQNPKIGDVVNAKGFYKASNLSLASPFVGGGEFVCVESSALVVDGGKIFQSSELGKYWVRVCDAGFYDVTWYGAVQDSVTDNTAIIQGILDRARPQNQVGVKNTSRYGTATLYFPSINPSYYYYATELHIPAFVTLKGEDTGNALKSTTMYLRSDLPNDSTTLYYNMNFKMQNLNFKQCKLNLFSKDTAKQSAGFMIIKLTDVYFDGSNEDNEGNTSGDCITVKNVTFDVHLDKVYVNGYTGHAYGVIADNQLGGGIGYLATGVFCTLSQCKFMNSGYGIYLQGAAADSTDIHCNNVLLDHNDVGLYADGTRSSGMGELHVYFDSGRIELNREHSIYAKGEATIQYKGWLLCPGNTPTSGNKVFLQDTNTRLSVDGRFNGYVSGNGNLSFSNNSIVNGYAKALETRVTIPRNQLFIGDSLNESIPLASATSTFKLTLNGTSGFTLQIVGSGVRGGVWFGGISYGLSIDKSVTSAITAASLTASVGTSGTRDYLGVAYQASDKLIELSMGNYTCDFVGFENIKVNSTGENLNLLVNISNTFKPQISFTNLSGANVDLFTLTGEIMFSFTTYMR